MLALLAAFYQCDLTLHTETSAYLGRIGVFASALWIASFVGKLYALAWAVRLRLSRSALVVPAYAAFGLAIVPQYSARVEASTLTTIVALWVFTLFASALWTSRSVTSATTLDEWGRTVFGRALRTTWIMWALLTMCHVLFWRGEYDLHPAFL